MSTLALSPSFSIKHGYRHKNMVADRLAAWAHEHKSRINLFRIEDCPQIVKSAHVADNLGLWSFRQ